MSDRTKECTRELKLDKAPKGKTRKVLRMYTQRTKKLQKFLNFLLVLTISLFAAHPEVSQAATLTTAVTRAESHIGCNLAFRGEINSGDFDDFVMRVKAYGQLPNRETDPEGGNPTGRICLDSPGGNLGETLKIVKFLLGSSLEYFSYFETGLAEGSQCLSSCALIFLSGHSLSYDDAISYGFSGNTRWIHPRAILGFHSPALPNLPQDLTRSQMDELFALGGKAIAEISSLRDDYPGYMTNSLFQVFVGTPFTQMDRLETVGEAALWNIGLTRVQLPDPPKEVKTASYLLSNLCANILRWHADLGVTASEPPPHSFKSVYQLDKDYLGNKYAIYGTDAIKDNTLGRLYGCVLGPPMIDSSALNFSPSYMVAFDISGAIDSSNPFVYSSADSPAFSFPPETPISKLPSHVSGTASSDTMEKVWSDDALQKFWEVLSSNTSSPQSEIASPQNQTNSALQSSTSVLKCTRDGRLRVVNVDEYVNIRSQASFRSSIVARAVRDEVLTSTNKHSWWFMGTRRGEQCSTLCEQVPNNAALQPQTQQCIADAEIWQEVQNSRGQTGFVSVKFLEELP